MAAGVLDRIPVDQIEARAASMRPGRFALTVTGGLLFAVGWLCAVTFAVAWKAGKWCAAAFLVGFESTHGPSKRQQITALRARVAAQDMQLSRFSG